ncbi:hypothetical protein Glove_212g33 [Diversispora epigaea]|uniref:Uncharacterized protein n=1 Tax=Diversispora epigaea TaxID=1348612 RepID=A0A397IRT8_9GLOM|nr:hypothetical protein Glove_212g33 [Diversispora epigaea]
MNHTKYLPFKKKSVLWRTNNCRSILRTAALLFTIRFFFSHSKCRNTQNNEINLMTGNANSTFLLRIMRIEILINGVRIKVHMKSYDFFLSHQMQCNLMNLSMF